MASTSGVLCTGAATVGVSGGVILASVAAAGWAVAAMAGGAALALRPLGADTAPTGPWWCSGRVAR